MGARDKLKIASRAKLPSGTVLIVDDTLVSLTLLDMMLEDTPLRVLKAHNGKEAMQVLRQHSVDCIITDLHMPDMSGLQLTSSIRTMELVEQPHIIITSADAKNDIWDDCVDAGADDYLEKPIDPQLCLAKLSEYLA